MMRKILVSALLVLALGASAHGAVWIKSLGNTGVDRLHATVDWNGTLYFGGSRDGGSTPSHAWLLATDALGTRLFDRAWADPSGRPAEIVALARGDGLYAAGHVGSLSRNVVVARLSATGSIDWQIEIGTQDDETVSDLLTLRDGGLLVVGTTRPVGESKRDGWVVRLDAGGGVVWQEAFRSDGDDVLQSATETPRGDYVLAGQVGIYKFPDTFQGWVLALDPAGNVRWQYGFDVATSDTLNSIFRSPGGYIAVGSAFQNAFFQGEAWILEINRNGGLIDSRLMGDFDFYGHDEFTGAVPTNAGGFVAAGNTDTVAGPSRQFWAAEFDNRGEPRWLRHFGGDAYDVEQALAEAADGDLVLAGITQSVDFIDGLIVKTTRDADVTPACALTGALPFIIYEFPPTVRTPVVTVDATTATVVAGSLTEETPATIEQSLCEY